MGAPLPDEPIAEFDASGGENVIGEGRMQEADLGAKIWDRGIADFQTLFGVEGLKEG
jgi:hypothetical protein